MSLRNNTFPVIQKAALMIVVSFVLMLTGITKAQQMLPFTTLGRDSTRAT